MKTYTVRMHASKMTKSFLPTVVEEKSNEAISELCETFSPIEIDEEYNEGVSEVEAGLDAVTNDLTSKIMNTEQNEPAKNETNVLDESVIDQLQLLLDRIKVFD